MSDTSLFVVIMIVFLVIPSMIAYLIMTKGKRLSRKFARLGDMTGKTCQQITEVVGKPTNVVQFTTSDTKVLVKNVTWSAYGYHVTIQFDVKTDVIKGIVSEGAYSA